MIAQLVVWHLGALHPYEKVLTFALAFGPFLVLLAVIALRRRQDRQDLSELDGLGREQSALSPPSSPGATPDPPGSPAGRL